MEFHVLKETPDNSSKYETTGEVLTGSVDDALSDLIGRSHDGKGRHAMFVHEAVRQPDTGAAKAYREVPAGEAAAEPKAEAEPVAEAKAAAIAKA